MTLGMTLIRRVVFFFTFAVITTLAAAQTRTRTPTPSPALVVTIEGDHALAIVDPLTMKAVATVHTEDVPHEVAVSDDGKLAFMSTCFCGKGRNPDSRTHIEGALPPHNDYISVIDLVAQKELRRVQTGPGSRVHGLVFVGGKLYFTLEGYSLVGRYDPVSNQIDWMFGHGGGRGHLLVVTKDEKKIFVANSAGNTVSAITPWDIPNRYMPPLRKVTQIPIGNSPEGMAISPDEKEVWVTTKRDYGASIIDTATLQVIKILRLDTEGPPLRLQFTPDGKRVLIADTYANKILVYDTATRKEIKKIDMSVNIPKEEPYEVYNDEATFNIRNGVPMIAKSTIREIKMAPDGSRAYVARFGVGRLDIVDLKTLAVTGSIPVGSSANSYPKGIAWVVRK